MVGRLVSFGLESGGIAPHLLDLLLSLCPLLCVGIVLIVVWCWACIVVCRLVFVVDVVCGQVALGDPSSL